MNKREAADRLEAFIERVPPAWGGDFPNMVRAVPRTQPPASARTSFLEERMSCLDDGERAQFVALLDKMMGGHGASKESAQ